MESRGIDGVALDDRAAVATELLHGLFGARHIDLQRLGGTRCQLGRRKIDMAVVAERFEHVQHARLNAQRRVAADAHSLRDAIGDDEADARHVARQPIRIVAHLGHRLVAVRFANPRRVGERYAEALQEDHHLALLPSRFGVVGGARGASLADALDLRGAPRLLLDHFDRFGAERGDEPLRQHRPNSLERFEVACHPAFGAGDLDDRARRAKLIAVRRMALPGPFELEQLAGGRFGERADDADRLVAAGDLHAQDGKRSVGRGEHHAQDAAFERFGQGHRQHEELIDVPRKKLRVRRKKERTP